MRTTTTSPAPPAWHNPRLPLWCRVWMYAEHNATNHVLNLKPEQLRKSVTCVVPPAQSDVSRAIKQAVSRGVLKPGSNARRLLTQERNER